MITQNPIQLSFVWPSDGFKGPQNCSWLYKVTIRIVHGNVQVPESSIYFIEDGRKVPAAG